MENVNSQLSIVLARPRDFESYVNLLEEVAEWLDSRGLGQLPRGIYREFADYYAASIDSGEVYLGLIGADLVGSFRLVHEDGVVWPDANDDALYLENLVVRRAWSGRSVGRQFLHWAEQQVLRSNKEYIRLDCFANNPVLRKYYEGAHYEPSGEVDARYPFGALRLQRFQKKLR
jgi:GNAT superfamily N-acetyltransferase